MPTSDQAISSDRYSVIPRVLVFLTRGEFVLLLKGAPTKRLWPGKYNGVGGHIERGEDALSAAKRELFEETGLKSALRLMGTVLVDTSGPVGILLLVFRGDSPIGDLTPSREGKAEWIPFSRLEEYQLVDDVAVMLHHLRGMGESEPPFCVHSFYDETEQLRIVFVE